MNIENSLDFFIKTLADKFSLWTSEVLAFVIRNVSFFLAITLTMIFYLPALKNGSIDAGFLYGGDVIGWYLPALAKTHVLFHSFNFTAIDFSAFNGSSDFFLSPNFFAYHPLIVVFSILIPPESINLHQTGHFLVLLVAFHSFLAFYFSLKLFTRFFGFDFGLASLIATAFAFGMYMVNALGQPPFFFCASIVPWAAYASLVYAQKPTAKMLVFACLPVIIGFMGGYMPMGVASLALSAVLVAVKIIYIDDSDADLNGRLKKLFVAGLPFIGASIVVSPYLISVYRFHQETSSPGVVSLFYSAHQLSQLPQSLLRAASTYFSVPGPMHEFTFMWGFVFISTAIIFFLSPKVLDRLAENEWKLFKVSVLIYFATVLATFGDFSVVSDLVYYLVPQVGGMHIYQRFLLPSQLVFAVIFALMLKAVVHERPLIITRLLLVLFLIATIWAAFIVAYKPALSQQIGLNNFNVIELFLAFLFLCVLTVPGKNFVYGAAIVLFLLPVLDRMYDYSLRGHTFYEQQKRQVIALNKGERDRLVEYLNRFNDKDVVKYVDITPMWGDAGVELFPKVFPYFVLDEMRLSSYGGFTFYLSARADYMSRMPVKGDVAVSPDWELVASSGADFVVARETDLQKGALKSVINNVRSDDLYKLSNGVVIVPLRDVSDKTSLSSKSIFDNGYFKIIPVDNKSKLENIALGKVARQSSFGGGEARLSVDGNTDGNFVNGSVTHSGKDVNAWLEIDLGKTEKIDKVKIWNRTDCCGERLQDYWIFISETPFKSDDTATELKGRPGIWGKINLTPNPKSTIQTADVSGRYVRVQLSGTQPISESFLSLAEVEILQLTKQSTKSSTQEEGGDTNVQVKEFTTDYASYLRLDLENSQPVTIQYLFWDNPRLSYFLNGKLVKLTEKDGLKGIDVASGKNTLEIKYRHWPLTIFWLFYSMYALLLVWFLITSRSYAMMFIKVGFQWLRDYSKSKW